MTLINRPTCDLCGGIDVNRLNIKVYEEETQENLEICLDCLETTTANFLPLPTDADLGWQ